jgi:hexosaminidase
VRLAARAGRSSKARRAGRVGIFGAALLAVAPPAAALTSAAATTIPATVKASVPQIIPEPVSLKIARGRFALTRTTRITVDPASPDALPVAEDLAADLRPATGYAIPVREGSSRRGDIKLAIGGPTTVTGSPTGEAYQLQVTATGVRLNAESPHGLFDGIQTIRQLLPPWIAATRPQPGPWTMPEVRITDYPRYQYRGFMLDLGRHFEAPAVVERLIDQISAYKLNVLHLHLSDDQGFRVAIGGFPNLTAIGAQGSVGTHGRKVDPGGFWTQPEYEAVVAYAAAHFITVVPEVDSPGHSNAIIMSEFGDTTNPLLDGHPQSVDCSTKNPPVWDYTTDVGYSALCPESSDTWKILTTIIDQLTALSPGQYYDLGGDEVPADVLSQARYAAFLNEEAPLVSATGKTAMAWADVAGPGVQLPAGSVAEYWEPAQGSDPNAVTAREAAAEGLRLVMAPADHTYLDEQYIVTKHARVPPTLGLHWACPKGCDVKAFYDWDPGKLITGVPAMSVIGVEAPLFGETVVNLANIDYLTYPRLPATAELAWSPSAHRTGTSRATRDFLGRLAGQGARWLAAGVNFYPSKQVPWRLDLEPNVKIATHGGIVRGALATLSAPGLRTRALTATISWGDGTRATAAIAGVAATTTQVNGLYSVSARHQYRKRGGYTATLQVSSAGKTTVTVPIHIRVT